MRWASRCFAKNRWARRWTTAARWWRRPQGQISMTGFNYIRTPASQFARQLDRRGRDWRCHLVSRRAYRGFSGRSRQPRHLAHAGRCQWHDGRSGTAYDQWRLALIGPIASLVAEVETVHTTRPGGTVTNDDHGQMMCRFANGAMGQMYFSRIAHGRKMGYAYEVTGTKGAIRFDQEDQNALWLYHAWRSQRPHAAFARS